jgi:hypothetical protein
MKKIFTLLLTLFSLGACELYPDLSDKASNTSDLDYNELNFEDRKDSYGSFIFGSGSVFVKKNLKQTTRIARIEIKARFTTTNSSLRVFSHSSSDFDDAYEIRLTRVGDSLRVVTVIGLEQATLGSLVTNISDWGIPQDIVIEVDNRNSPVSLVVRGNSGAPLTEERDEFPQGVRTGAIASTMAIYKISVTERL